MAKANNIIQIPDSLQKYIKEKKLTISVSGIRFHFPDGLSLEEILNIIQTYSKINQKRIVVGNDGRITSPILHNFIISILRYYNKDVLDLGTVPTPTVKAICNLSRADGGIIITASHNPEEWNGIKFLKKGGFFFEVEDYIHFFIHYNQKPKTINQILGKYQNYEGIKSHIHSIAKIIPNTEEIIKKKYRVVIDPVNSSGIYAIPELLKFLNCEIVSIHMHNLAGFERPPEPIPSALKKFSNMVKKTKSSVGFALDPDGDRLVCGSPTSGAINEEYTLALAYLGKRINLNKKSKFVVNFSTASVLDRLARGDGNTVLRAPVGEANVIKRMMQLKSTFGGEGNGGVIDLNVPSRGRDSLTAIFLILSAMAYYNANTIDDLIKMLPPLYMYKQKIDINIDKKDKILLQLRELIENKFKDQIIEVSTEDGFYFSLMENSWIHIRGSNTEPILRIIY